MLHSNRKQWIREIRGNIYGQQLPGFCFSCPWRLQPDHTQKLPQTFVCLFPTKLGPKKAVLQGPLFKPSVSFWAPHAEWRCGWCEEKHQRCPSAELSGWASGTASSSFSPAWEMEGIIHCADNGVKLWLTWRTTPETATATVNKLQKSI